MDPKISKDRRKEMKQKEDDKLFFFIKISKIKTDKDYFILVVLFICFLYAIPIQRMGFYDFCFEEMRVKRSLVDIIIISIILFYVLFCLKNFKRDK